MQDILKPFMVVPWLWLERFIFASEACLINFLFFKLLINFNISWSLDALPSITTKFEPLNSILENWVDWVLHPKWFFSYKSMMPNSRFFKNYGYTVPGAMKGKLGIVSITYGGPMISYFNFSIFDNIPYRRIKKAVFNLGGMKTKYIRFYSVLPGMSKEKFNTHMHRVRKLVHSL